MAEIDPNIEIELDGETLAALGYIKGVNVINKFGRNTDVDTGVSEDMWNGGGFYTGFPTTGSAEPLGVASSSANDTAAGTGARTVMIIGLDANYQEISETVTLNGTTEVFTTQSFWRAHTANVRTSGGTPTNSAFSAGQITIRHQTTTANVFMVMPAATNQAASAGYTVPAGHRAVLKRIHGAVRGSTSASVDISLWVRLFGFAPRLRRPTTLYFGSELDDTPWGGLVFPEKTDIHVRILSASANNLDIVGGYDLVVVGYD
jgi:hypothetical protein